MMGDEYPSSDDNSDGGFTPMGWVLLTVVVIALLTSIVVGIFRIGDATDNKMDEYRKEHCPCPANHTTTPEK